MNYPEVLHGFSVPAIAIRVLLALLVGGVIGLERGKKRRAAGSRTYMLVCIGAACAILLGYYNARMQTGAEDKAVDVTRYGAQVINGIGFLGAGTIMISDKQDVVGLTTAAALWTSACTGLAIGAGFYVCAVLALILIFVSVRLLPRLEERIIAHSRDMNLRVNFLTLDYIYDFFGCVKAMDVRIYSINVFPGLQDAGEKPCLLVSLRLPKGMRRTKFLAALTEVRDISSIKEV